ncbi:MAG TPA: DNA helicase RecG, partial [Nitrospira sp.]|nr:DNA helicase RecG [Nitrospira sp.]
MIPPSPVIPTTDQPLPIPLSDDPPRPLWELSIQFVKGVGPKRTILLQRLGISTVEEALWTLPWRYEDRSVVTPVAKLVPGGIHCVCGVIIRAESTRARSRRLS